jgi:hypothetical protein
LIDEGRPLGTGWQGQVPNHLLAAVVKSHGREHSKEKAWEEPGQVTGKKRTAREPLMTCRKRMDDVETAGSRYCGISSGDGLLTDGAASGIKVA